MTSFIKCLEKKIRNVKNTDYVSNSNKIPRTLALKDKRSSSNSLIGVFYLTKDFLGLYKENRL